MREILLRSVLVAALCILVLLGIHYYPLLGSLNFSPEEWLSVKMRDGVALGILRILTSPEFSALLLIAAVLMERRYAAAYQRELKEYREAQKELEETIQPASKSSYFRKI